MITDTRPFDEFLNEKFPSNTYAYLDNDFSNCLVKAGVWACFGLPNGNKTDWKCLNVGSSNKIGLEMRTNHNYLQGVFAHKSGEYKNFRGTTIFKFDRPKNEPITIRERVWKHIGEHYEHLHFVVILLSDNEKERLQKEMDFADETEAIYWNPSPKQRKMMKKSN